MTPLQQAFELMNKGQRASRLDIWFEAQRKPTTKIELLTVKGR
jgi:hypothetical protein